MSTKIKSIIGYKEEPQTIILAKDGAEVDYLSRRKANETWRYHLICGEMVAHFFDRNEKLPNKIIIKAYRTTKDSKKRPGWMKITIMNDPNNGIIWYYRRHLMANDDTMYSDLEEALIKHFPQVEKLKDWEKLYLYLKVTKA